MARPQLISDSDVDRCAALYACGGTIAALAETFSVRPVTLRKRIRDRFGVLPLRIPRPADPGWLAAAARLLDGLAAAADSFELRNMASAVRDAQRDAEAVGDYIRRVGNGEVPPPVDTEGGDAH